MQRVPRQLDAQTPARPLIARSSNRSRNFQTLSHLVTANASRRQRASDCNQRHTSISKVQRIFQ
jgi:methylphosphotriester-DNA--protein-cysteine methyltransferase